MANIWNLGNTTLRNPNRIIEGLKIFSKSFQGAVHGEDEEIAFAKALVENGIVDSESTGEYEAFLARKWRSAFVKLGFVTNTSFKYGDIKFDHTELHNYLDSFTSEDSKKYVLTPVGQRLVNAQTTGEIDDIYLRQLVATEMPSIIENNYKGAAIKPFILLLQVIYTLQSNNGKGLNKDEIAIFLQYTDEHTKVSVDSLVNEILSYRSYRENLPDKRSKLEFDRKLMVKTAIQGKVKPGTLRDYADTTVRYSLMSGVLSFSSARIVVKEDKLELVSKLIENEPIFLSESNPLEYLKVFYTGIKLPFDNADFNKSLTKQLQSRLESISPEPQATSVEIDALPDNEITSLRYKFEEEIKILTEEKYAVKQMDGESISEIYDILVAFKENQKEKLEDYLDKPAYFEWITWRAFLAIDNIVNKISDTRGFPIDDDMQPRHPASGGKPDLFFEFEDFSLVVEVSLTTSVRQIVAESEPVKRHVAKIKQSHDKDVFGVFIAPSIDNNVLDSFRNGVYYEGDTPIYVNIVPLNIGQFMRLIDTLSKRRYTPTELKKLFSVCLSTRNTATHDWKNIIHSEVERWANNLVNNK